MIHRPDARTLRERSSPGELRRLKFSSGHNNNMAPYTLLEPQTPHGILAKTRVAMLLLMLKQVRLGASS
jgi:hypothetical protein